MSQPDRIFLIGYRGCGKTTVAKALASELGYDWVDVDVEIGARAGKSIADFFSEQGESAYRDLESEVVADLCERSRAVVALGGGSVIREQNRQQISGVGPVVWLTASVDKLHERINADPNSQANRPSLTSLGGRDEIETVLGERTPAYRECATLEIDTEGKPVARIVAEILHSKTFSR